MERFSFWSQIFKEILQYSKKRKSWWIYWRVLKTYFPDHTNIHATWFLTPLTPSWKIYILKQHYLKHRFLTVKHHFTLETQVYIKLGCPNYQILHQNVEFRLVLVIGTVTPNDCRGLSFHAPKGVKNELLMVSSNTCLKIT